MNAGKVEISKKLLFDLFQFPILWDIVDATVKEHTIEFTFTGEEFPEVIDSKIKECFMIIHKENISFEVKEK